MLNIIKNNPYRFLGVCSNAPVKERVANGNRLKAYLKVGKDVSFPLDMSNIIPPIKRTTDGMETANSCINLPEDQLKYALFWFINASPIDQMALEYLRSGNQSKAAELFQKKETYSSLLNNGILSFINEDYGLAIQSISKVIHNDDYRAALINAVCGSTFDMEENELAQLFIDALLLEFKASELVDLFDEYGESADDDDYLKEKSVGEPIAAINAAISLAKAAKNNDARAQYEAGVTLMNSTKEHLSILEEELFTGEYVMEDVAMLEIGLPIQVPRKVYNDQYIFIADNLAKNILQCSINYYSHSKEEEETKIEKALGLADYALSISVGKLTKERCRENRDILKEKQDELPPKEVRYYDNLIKKALASYRAKPEKINHAIDLIKQTIPYLMSIKEVLGANHAYYLRISTIIVNASLNNIIEEFNNVLGDDIKIQMILDRDRAIRKLKLVFDQAWKATLYMDKLDMEPSFKQGRYNQNRKTLKEQVEQLINIHQSVSLDMRGETRFYNDCRTVSDYKSYLSIYPGGKYAAQALDAVEKYEFDLCKTTRECQAFKEKYPNTKYPIASKNEDCYFNECKTVSQLKAYLKDYPSGKYVAKAKEKIDDLSFSSCTTLSDYQSYVRIFPNGKHRSEAQQIINDEEMWSRCASSDTKDMYKQYLAQFPNGRHKSEAEKKASACYIATMVYGDYNHPQVIILRRFRDDKLYNTYLGRAFIRFYYRNSPSWVEKMQSHKTLNSIIRIILDNFIKIYNNESK